MESVLELIDAQWAIFADVTCPACLQAGSLMMRRGSAGEIQYSCNACSAEGTASETAEEHTASDIDTALDLLTAYVRTEQARGWYIEYRETLAVNMAQGKEIDQLRAALVAATAERDHARRHVELLREELDAVPVAALDALADSADAVPAKIIEWLAWSTLGAHWQPADSPCPDCGANALAVAIHADGTIEQWLCDACGYVAAEKSKVQP